VREWLKAFDRWVVGSAGFARTLGGERASPVKSIPRSVESPVAPQPPGFHGLLNSRGVFQRLGVEGQLKAICEKTRYGQQVFERDCMPVLEGLCDLVQLLPATSSRYHTGPGGMLVHALLSTSVALQLRLGEILPRGGASEDVHRREHRWTYGVMVSALLHDLGNLCSELRVIYRTEDGDEKCWHPAAGTLRSMGAVCYRARGAGARGLLGENAARLPILFLHDLVPAQVLHWLAEDCELMDEMLLSLCGVMSEGAIAQIVHRAHDESVARAANVLGPPPSIRRPTVDTEPPEARQGTSRRCAPTTKPRSPNEGAQQVLFDENGRPGSDPQGEAATTIATGETVLATVLTLDLPSTLTPMVREALSGIFDSLCASCQEIQSQYVDETGWFVPLASLEGSGVDPGLALKCLLEAQVLYIGQTGEKRKVHTRHIAETDVRGVIIKPEFFVKSGVSA
jgi:hypothetical protein